MHDEKRRMRQLKRQVKQAGNRRLRRHLKNVDAEVDQFDYGRDRSEVMNEPKTDRKSSAEAKKKDSQPRADEDTV